ncbi:hypothetical protein A4R35_09890 [Thermogemmatispora tikiterensis]|uniref:Uncharacterized protein n=1 Tax=Thermogemmatispora tikiterensis TaxID=1825093 RepID=A0A328VE89_9CHLR|nr:hypothetical protein A4R35_09890 [Thermogemmatispora tikiterensis]
MYETFFATYMASRRERNSLLCTGTMGLVRRRCLEEVGLWDETCVTEDAELSICLPGKGWKGVDDHRPYGAGLMPLEFDALKKHWRPLLGLASPVQYHLTLIQRLLVSGRRLPVSDRRRVVFLYAVAGHHDRPLHPGGASRLCCVAVRLVYSAASPPDQEPPNGLGTA